VKALSLCGGKKSGILGLQLSQAFEDFPGVRLVMTSLQCVRQRDSISAVRRIPDRRTSQCDQSGLDSAGSSVVLSARVPRGSVSSSHGGVARRDAAGHQEGPNREHDQNR